MVRGREPLLSWSVVLGYSLLLWARGGGEQDVWLFFLLCCTHLEIKTMGGVWFFLQIACVLILFLELCWKLLVLLN
jgi:hypothetical protein